jgi:hypothetical protein
MRTTLAMAMATGLLMLGCGGPAPASHHATGSGSSGSDASTGTTRGQVSGGGTNGQVMGSTAAASSSSSSSSSSTTTLSSTASSSGSTASTSTSGAGSVGSTSGTSSTSSASTGISSGSGSSGSSGGQCFGNGTFPGGGVPCCSGYTDASGYCADPPASSSTTSTSTSSTGGSGSTTGTTGATSTSGSTGASCSQACYSARGYHCENGVCVLNGNTGPIQVTLYWGTTLQSGGLRAREDVDLHMIDPGGCEIFYGNKTCGTGTLDLDSNAGCGNTDNPGSFGNDTENIIYMGTPAHGTYQVFADLWAGNCDGAGDPDPFTYRATVRYAGQTQVIQGVFHQSDANRNSHSGPGWAHILDFTY